MVDGVHGHLMDHVVGLVVVEVKISLEHVTIPDLPVEVTIVLA